MTSGAALARQVEPRARGPRPRAPGEADREGDYRFLTTGDVEAFRALGTRFLQMPLGEVEHVDLPRWPREASSTVGVRRRATRRQARRDTVGRSYERGPDGLRPTRIDPGFVPTAAGSALIAQGETRVICTASVTECVPRWMTGRGTGWVTAEYGMLPASTGQRKERDATRGRPDGRTDRDPAAHRRSIRGVVDFAALGERTIHLDCDVLTADGGTRCASITGAQVAFELACVAMSADGRFDRSPVSGSVAAISCGIVGGVPLLDLDYREDSTAEVDANVVMTGDDGLVEVQATAERTPLSPGAPRRAARARRRAGSRSCGPQGETVRGHA